MAEGVDFSFSRVSGASLRAAGKTFAVRYLWRNTNGSKGISRAEYNDLSNNGIAVAFVYEEDGTELTGGYAAGQRVAQAAQACLNTLGIPGAVVYFAIDHDYSGAALAACVQGVRGAASVLGWGRTGLYGGYNHIVAAQQANACAYFWQTYAWSGGRLASGIHLYQYNNGVSLAGASVDLVRSYQSNFGQVGTSASSLNATLIGGFLMSLSDDQQRQMYEALVSGGPTAAAYYKTDALINIARQEIAPVVQEIRDALLKPSDLSGQFRPIDVLVSQVVATLAAVDSRVQRDGQTVTQAADNAATGTLVHQLVAQVAALQGAVESITAATGADPKAVQAAAEAGAKAALDNFALNINLTGKGTV